MNSWVVAEAHCCFGNQAIALVHTRCGTTHVFGDNDDHAPPSGIATLNDLMNVAVSHVCLAKTGTS